MRAAGVTGVTARSVKETFVSTVLVRAILVLMACLGSGATFADTVTTGMAVLVEVLPVATVTTTSLSFGSFTLDSKTVMGSATITVLVSSGVPYHIALDAGKHYSRTWRNVESSGSLIEYGLFQESGDEWGDADYSGTYPRGGSLAGTGTGTLQSYVVRGVLYVSTAAADSQSGAYQDVVGVTVYY
jgi:spore coat protein U-like protein